MELSKVGYEVIAFYDRIDEHPDSMSRYWIKKEIKDQFAHSIARTGDPPSEYTFYDDFKTVIARIVDDRVVIAVEIEDYVKHLADVRYLAKKEGDDR